MLRLEINRKGTTGRLTDIEYEVVSEDENSYLMVAMPAGRDYHLSNGEEVTLSSEWEDGTTCVRTVKVSIDSGMTEGQFRIAKLDNVALPVADIKEYRYEDGTSELYLSCSADTHMAAGVTMTLAMEQPWSAYGGDSDALIRIGLTVTSATATDIGFVMSGDLRGVPEAFMKSVIVSDSNFPYITVTAPDRDFFRDGYWPKIGKRRANFVVPVDLSEAFATNLYQELEVEENFVEAETEKAINPIVDMEKDVYFPAYVVDQGNNTVSADNARGQNLGLVEEIEINLHFRERDRSPENLNDWLVREDDYWNGYSVQGNRLAPKDGTWTTSKMVTFDDPAAQSDLLTYLNFTDNDVKYQKSRLKKSFLRLLFYDSKNTANQRLLYYSTIFMDSGKYFGKHLKFYDSGERYWVSDTSNPDTVTAEAVSGMTVSGELDRSLYDDEGKEERRLSARFTVRDKYQSDASSEGFYLYLFAEDDTGLRPQDVYMRVEFNHAGYGRTIPFMMPVQEKAATYVNNGVTVDYPYYSAIDIKDSAFPYEGYRLSRYYDNLFIQLKRVYDKENQRHVYYLPAPMAAPSGNGETAKLVLNLYEVKVQ